MDSNIIQCIQSLPCWSGNIEPEPLTGGISNINFRVDDNGKSYFVRAGEDVLLHGVMRFNELRAARAAHSLGITPDIIYQEPGILVSEYIHGETLTEEKLRQDDVLTRVLDLLKHAHTNLPHHIVGPCLMFWVFHVNRDYIHALKKETCRLAHEFPQMIHMNYELELAVDKINVIFGHNDILAANFIDDGEKLWLIDWEFAGFNSALFDLASLAANNQLTNEQEKWMLSYYFDQEPSDVLWRRYSAMKCASALRETLWSLVSEVHSKLEFDYVNYSNINWVRCQEIFQYFKSL